MSMENISKVSINAKVGNTNRADTNQVHPKTKKDKQSTHTTGPDTIDISKETKNFIQMVANLKTAVSEMPDVRAEKIEEVKVKLKEGFYDKPEVINEVANKIVDAFSIKGLGS